MSICSGFVTYVYQCIFHFAVIDEEATNIIFSSAFAIVAVADTTNIADTADTLGYYFTSPGYFWDYQRLFGIE
jgi:hypothetical protein